MNHYRIFYRWRDREYIAFQDHLSAIQALTAATLMLMPGARIYGIERGVEQ